MIALLLWATVFNDDKSKRHLSASGVGEPVLKRLVLYLKGPVC